MVRVFARRAASRRSPASDSLARSLARSPRYAPRPTGEKPQLKPIRRYERLSPGDEIELLLGAPGFELRSARLPRRALRFPVDGDPGERVGRSCVSSIARVDRFPAGVSRSGEGGSMSAASVADPSEPIRRCRSAFPRGFPRRWQMLRKNADRPGSPSAGCDRRGGSERHRSAASFAPHPAGSLLRRV